MTRIAARDSTPVVPGVAADEPVRPVAYLTKRFPRLSETFILDEVLGLEDAGVPLRLFAIRDPHESLVQPDVARVRGSLAYLRPEPAVRARLGWLGSTVAGHARVAAAHPARYWRTLVDAFGHRQRRAALSHFLDAGHLAARLERDDARRLHAAFAHGPAAIAHQVHLLTGLPFSFAAHAKDIYVSDPEQLARRAAAAEFMLVCSESAREELARIAGPAADRIRLQYHGVDALRFHPGGTALAAPFADGERPADEECATDGERPAASKRPTDGARPFRLLAAGRLVEKKGYPVLLDALALLARQGHAVTCRIVGAGPLRADLEARARALGIAGTISFDGAISHENVAGAYRDADAFVQCSVVLPDGDRDGVPNVVLEAMASGLAVVASDVAGIPEAVVDGVTGFLVPPSDPAAVADRIARLVENPALAHRLGAAGRSRVLERFDRAAAVRNVARLMLDAARAGDAQQLSAPIAAPQPVPARPLPRPGIHEPGASR